MKNIVNGTLRQTKNFNILNKQLSDFEEVRLPSYCEDNKKRVKHLSDCLARIYLATNKNKIDKIMKEMKIR